MSERKPEKTFRHKSGTDRNLSVAVWRNESNGRTWLAAGRPQLQYKEEEEWKESTSFSAFDLFALQRCVTDAIAFIHFEEMKEKREHERAA